MLLEKPRQRPCTEQVINLQDPYSIDHWTKVFRIGALDLTIAVHNAGCRPEDVAHLLGVSWR